MRPGVLAPEALQKLGRGDGSTGSASHIGHIGKFGFESLGIGFVQGHAPAQITTGLARIEQGLAQGVVVGVEAGTDMSQSNHAGARQSGNVHHGTRLEALGIGHGITQHQAAFCVGVEDLDGLPAHAGDHITGLGGLAVWHVFSGRNQAHHIEAGLQPGQGLEGAQHTGGAAHVVFHLVHALAGLERDAAGIESDAFANQHHRCLFGGAAVVAQHNKPQGLNCAFGHREECAHLEFGDLFGTQHFALDVFVLGQLLGHPCEHGGCCMVAGPVGPFFGQFNTGNTGLGTRNRLLEVGTCALHAQTDAAQTARFGAAQCCGVNIALLRQQSGHTVERCIVPAVHSVPNHALDFGLAQRAPHTRDGRCQVTTVQGHGTA